MIPKDLLVSFFSIAGITKMDMFYVDCREEIQVFLWKHYTLTDVPSPLLSTYINHSNKSPAMNFGKISE